MGNRVLKFKPTLPLLLESRLVNRFGYAVLQRIPGECISFIHSPKPFNKQNNVVVMPVNHARQAELLKRCDNIVEFFKDPYNCQQAVRTRLHNMAQTLTMAEKQFVMEYMDDNFPIEDKGL